MNAILETTAQETARSSRPKAARKRSTSGNGRTSSTFWAWA